MGQALEFCSPFDARLAAHGPPAVFLRDLEGRLRFDAEWTRDAWERVTGDAPFAPCWALARDADSGYVLIVLSTSPALLVDHPRLTFQRFDGPDAALSALAELGRPPVVRTPW